MRRLTPEYWNGRRVLVTGHMGFKGVWLCSLLDHLGARVWGYGKDDREELLFSQMSLSRLTHILGDINDLRSMSDAIAIAQPEIIFHLAAQPIVLTSYSNPVETFDTNTLGSVKLMSAARFAKGVKAIVMVTSDKVYRNVGQNRGYRESDPLGGLDPYSASKAASEIVIESMAHSFFSGEKASRVATARAGNVIGGGDWASHRLVPDAARALRLGNPLKVRNPSSIRPWQHVLDPLLGYLMLASFLVDHPSDKSFTAWNFGPSPAEQFTVAEVANAFVSNWGQGASWVGSDLGQDGTLEAATLAVDSTKAKTLLGWSPLLTPLEAVARTAIWYRDHKDGVNPAKLVDRDIREILQLVPVTMPRDGTQS